MAAFNNGDAALLSSYYTEYGELLPPNSETVTGRESVQKFCQGVMNMGIKNAKLETVELEAMGIYACEIGKYTLFTAADTVVDRGKYIVLWKYVDDKWFLHRDIWNSSIPL
jgi:ketosteroid isomerase-like protein